jgi:hypothetical protein
MTDEKANKVTFQWIAGILISIILLIAGVMLTDTRGDIKDTRDIVNVNSGRLTALEVAGQLQFAEIRQWRTEMKESLEKIAIVLDAHERNTREQKEATVKMKRWQDVPASR